MPTQFKDSREQCYLARDKYWGCLDLNSEEEQKCISFRKDFENSCLNQWVKYFDRKRKFEKFKADAANNVNLPRKPS